MTWKGTIGKQGSIVLHIWRVVFRFLKNSSFLKNYFYLILWGGWVVWLFIQTGLRSSEGLVIGGGLAKILVVASKLLVSWAHSMLLALVLGTHICKLIKKPVSFWSCSIAASQIIILHFGWNNRALVHLKSSVFISGSYGELIAVLIGPAILD